MRGAESGGRHGGVGNAADVKHDILHAPLVYRTNTPCRQGEADLREQAMDRGL